MVSTPVSHSLLVQWLVVLLGSWLFPNEFCFDLGVGTFLDNAIFIFFDLAVITSRAIFYHNVDWTNELLLKLTYLEISERPLRR